MSQRQRISVSRRPSYQPRLECLEERAVPTAGGLNPRFDHGGENCFSFNGGSIGTNAIAALPGGGVVVAGSDANGNLLVAELNSHGQFRAGFGQAGEVVLPLGLTNGIGSVVTDDDGNITIVGENAGAFTPNYIPPDLVLVHLHRDGHLDTSFNGTGTYEIQGGFLALSGVAVSPCGQTYVGYVDFNGTPDVLRLTRAGTPDPTFGNGGLAVLPFVNGFFAGEGNGLALTPDGKVVMVGTAPDANSVFGFAAARLNSDGTPDTSFGSDGSGTVVFGDGSGADFATGVVVQDNGRIDIVGGAPDPVTGNLDLAVAKLDRNGSLVSNFGTGGLSLIQAPQGIAAEPIDISLGYNDQIVVVASTQNPSPDPVFPGGYELARLNRNGSLDTTFGTQGIVLVAPSNLSTSTTTFNTAAASGVVVQDDGTIDVGGAATYFDSSAQSVDNLSFFVTSYRG
jgi:uncharacterized delta-60 repeat protein